MDKRIRVIAVDDHEVVLNGLCNLISRQEDLEVVGTARDGREAVELAGRLDPDVIVMDISMPGLNGVSATKQIASGTSHPRVLAYSVHDSAEIVRQALESGAQGYVSKAVAVDELPRAIRAVACGDTFLSSDIRVAPRRKSAAPAGSPAPAGAQVLSAREKEVMQLVAEGKTTKEIAAILHITPKTVEWHRGSIMSKLGLRSVAEVTRFAIREGISPL